MIEFARRRLPMQADQCAENGIELILIRLLGNGDSRECIRPLAKSVDSFRHCEVAQDLDHCLPLAQRKRFATRGL